MSKRMMVLMCSIFLIVPLLFVGCGSDGSNGAPGTPAPTSGAVSGTVVDSNNAPLSGVTVGLQGSGNPAPTPMTATTDASGQYTISNVPNGTYTLTFAKPLYTSPGGLLIGIIPGQTITSNATMSAAATHAPSVAIVGYSSGFYTAPSGASDDFGYGGTAQVAASATGQPGDTLTYAWSNGNRSTPWGNITGDNTATPPNSRVTLTFPSLDVAFAPRPSLNNTTGDKEGDIAGYNYRKGYYGVIPIMDDTRGDMTPKVTVTNQYGQTASTSLNLHAASVATGTQNLDVGARVYLNRGVDNASIARTWSIKSKPAGSAAALDNATLFTPSFVADVAGAYVIGIDGAPALPDFTVYAGTFAGVIDGPLAGDPNGYTFGANCTLCHNDTFAINEFDDWYGTPHAHIFSNGINGGSGSSGVSCLGCHTVGFDRGTAGGFDGEAIAKGWKFPSPFATTNWDNMLATFPTVARLANIQCENCHGPNNSAAHTIAGTLGAPDNTNPYGPTNLSPRVAWSAELCATCHAAGSGHNIYSQWSSSAHNEPNIVPEDGDTAKLRVDEGGSKSCARCHVAQGFPIYLEQLAVGNIGDLLNTKTPAVPAQPGFAKFDPATAQPVTCTACHDPHDISNPNQLRVFNDTPVLTAGFKVADFGKGALCITCHQSRRGFPADNAASSGSSVYDATKAYLHQDGFQSYNFSTPHGSAQGDVFVGKNAYFLGKGVTMQSKHATVEDTCVGCHMVNNPTTHVAHGATAVDGHRFGIDEEKLVTFCANCHGAPVNGEALKANTAQGLASIAAKMGTSLLTVLKTNGGNITLITSSADNTNIPPANFTSATYTSGTSFTLVWDNVTAGGPRTKSVSIANIRNSADNTYVVPPPHNLNRAAWNYVLISNDGTGGIHNPSFVQAVINATLGADLTVAAYDYYNPATWPVNPPANP